MRTVLILAFATAGMVFLQGSSPVRAEERACGSRAPINTLKDMWPALHACWTPPPGTAGMAITLVFSLRRDGSLIGKPKATYSKSSGDEKLKRLFVASVLEALNKTLPLPITTSFGEAIAGRPLALLFQTEEKNSNAI